MMLGVTQVHQGVTQVHQGVTQVHEERESDPVQHRQALLHGRATRQE